MGLLWGALGSQLVRHGVSQLPGTTPSELPCPSRWCLRSPVVHTHHLTDEAMHDIPERDESSPQSHDEQDPSHPRLRTCLQPRFLRSGLKATGGTG